MEERYYSFNRYLRERFGCRVHKIGMDAGLPCPNKEKNGGCVFCLNEAFCPPSRKPLPVHEQIKQGIESGKNRFHAERFMAYFQARTNTAAPPAVLKEIYDVIRAFPEIVALAIGTRPDCVDEQRLDLIASYAKKYEVWMEYGLQSIHDKTLKTINRNHTGEDFIHAYRMTKERGLKVCVHLIIGLPGETEEDILETAGEMGRLAVDGVKIHPLHVVKGTLLAEQYRTGDYTPWEMERYARTCVKFLELLSPTTVIQRLTADCPPEYLIAPGWITDKTGVVATIASLMEDAGTVQGRKAVEGGR